MIALTLAEVARAVGGVLRGASGTEEVTGGVEFDSRLVGPGGLFVAVPGERVDGHDFAAAAVRAGAVGVLAGRPVGVASVLAPRLAVGSRSACYVLAADTDGAGAAVLVALSALARTVVRSLSQGGLQVVALTGSSGKTSTKDMVAALCQVAPPSIGVVLNVGSAHLGEFGSRDAVASAKGELVEALPAAGIAVLNADDPAVAAMDRRTAARVVRFGQSPSAHVRATELAHEGRGCFSFRLVTPVGEARIELTVPGEHQVYNGLAAAAVAVELGATPAGIAAVLQRYRPASRWRMEVTDRPDGVTVVNDAYNANPESVAAALRALVAMAGTARRSWAVLGPLAELGEATAQAYRTIGALAVSLGVNRLVVVGEQARSLYSSASASPTGRSAPVLVADAPAALELLHGELVPGDVVLIKASRAVGLERVAEGLLGTEGSRGGAQTGPPISTDEGSNR
ncbi:MAG: UDP-N-acetylmuramoyl-tripeptide--D-alanyl-D-alanine ligase [Pseudonocardiaceae bacterium]